MAHNHEQAALLVLGGVRSDYHPDRQGTAGCIGLTPDVVTSWAPPSAGATLFPMGKLFAVRVVWFFVLFDMLDGRWPGSAGAALASARCQCHL